MAKKTTSNNSHSSAIPETKSMPPYSETPPSITVTYDLFDLPTAQHKAGLAGLILQIDSMTKRHKSAPTYEWDKEELNTKVAITFTEEDVISLFDDVYSAEKVEVKVRSPWKGAPEKCPPEEVMEEVDGKQKKIKYFFYETIIPKCLLLKQYLTSAPEIWLKLWRDMLWAIPRGNPQSRQPFEQCANGQTCKEGPSTWNCLQKVQKARLKHDFPTESVAGSLWLGAQATNAENISFEGRLDQNVLLHFWPLTSLVYVPQVIETDGISEFAGYVLAIPDVINLREFIKDYLLLLSSLDTKQRGYRPAEAVIDLPAQGGLSFLEHLARLAQSKAANSEIRMTIGSIDFLHMVKIGNNIKTVSSGRIVACPHLLEDYQLIVGRPGQPVPYHNPLFRRGLMLALLENTSWYKPFGKMFADWPHKFFVPSESSPRKLAKFWADARRKLKEIHNNMTTDPHESPPDDDLIATAINRFICRYLDMTLQKKNSAWDFKKFRQTKGTPRDAAEARESLAERLFLEFRSRRDQAFVDHFSGTFFSVSQYLGKDFEKIANALMSRTDDVKTLTLMALSANSWIPVNAQKKETV